MSFMKEVSSCLATIIRHNLQFTLGLINFTPRKLANVYYSSSQDFIRGSDASGQLCVYVKGERVVDLWGSHGPKGDPNYGPDSLQVT